MAHAEKRENMKSQRNEELETLLVQCFQQMRSESVMWHATKIELRLKLQNCKA